MANGPSEGERVSELGLPCLLAKPGSAAVLTPHSGSFCFLEHRVEPGPWIPQPATGRHCHQLLMGGHGEPAVARVVLAAHISGEKK